MNVQVSRRQFMKLTGAGTAGSALAAFGFADAEQALAQTIRPFKLAKTTETRNTCPYCSVACGILRTWPVPRPSTPPSPTRR